MLTILADLGEFIGGIAVVITLIYFAIQIRANLNANRAQALSTWTIAAQAEKEALYGDSGLSRLFREVVLEGKSPDGDEAIRIYAFFTQLMNTWQLAYVQYRSGVILFDYLQRLSTGYVIYLKSKHFLSWWEELGCSQYDAEFVDYVAKKLQENS